MKKLKLAVIGADVSRSLSPQIHCFIAEKSGYCVEYDKIFVAEGEFDGVAQKLFKEYDGFNVTIPYKLRIMRHLERLESDAAVFGAVNTVKCREKSGYNTDGAGFMLMLENAGIEVKGKDFLVLGAGGAGRSAVKKLLDGGAGVTVYNRSAQKAKALANEFNGAIFAGELTNKPYYGIVNATGMGMGDSVGISPVGKDLLSLCEVAVDLIYSPAKTEFLRIAEGLGKRAVNGLAMLFYQAYFAECIFTKTPYNGERAKQLFEEFKKSFYIR